MKNYKYEIIIMHIHTFLGAYYILTTCFHITSFSTCDDVSNMKSQILEIALLV